MCRIVRADALILSVLTCISGSAIATSPLSFSDEALARGLDYQIGFNYSQFGAGLGMFDFDNDGDLDIVVAGAGDYSVGIYENDGTGNFSNHTSTSGIPNSTQPTGISGADYDNDGDIDLYLGGWMSPSKLYRNNGDFTFTDVTAQAGIDINCPSMGSSWGDIDNDGNLDLYVSVRTNTFADQTNNFFYKNNGDGTFTEQGAALGIDAPSDPTLLSSFFDYDRDGDDDLYLGTDKGTNGSWNNRMYRNDGGTFTEVTAETNTYGNVDCMGIGVGDLNFDGKFDLYLTNITAGNKLLMNDGMGVYTDETIAAGVGSYLVGWGTVFADFDNDTNLDLYVCNMLGENRLYRGSQFWPLVDEAQVANVDEDENVFCVAVGDVDGDNDLDMLVGNSGGRVHLYINNSPDLKKKNWVRFNVVGNNDNVFGVGTCVDLRSRGRSQVREVRSGVNYKAQDEYTIHYGLGQFEQIDYVNVIFPGGEVRTLTNPPADHTWTLYPESKLGDPDQSGQIEWDEIIEAIGLQTAPGETIVPGQEIFDMDGDFDIDLDDIAEMGLGLREPSVFVGN